MNLPAFQKEVTAFVKDNGLEISVEARVLDLASEVGGLAKKVLRASRYGRDPFRPSGEWVGDLGDALFSLICLANSTNVDLELALRQTLDAYQQRLAHRRASQPDKAGE